MVCEVECPLEQVSRDPASPGVVEDHEVVCRGAFGKRAHYNSLGVKPNFIRDRDLLLGELSVWRLSFADISEIRNELDKRPPEGNTLWDIFGINASSIRAIRVPSWEGRVISVLDDCRVDTEGGKHPAHAALAICQSLNLGPEDKSSPLYVEIRDELARLFKSTVHWALPQSQRQ
jgi:hypothetical protein